MTANRPSRVKSGAGIRRFLMIGGVVSALGLGFVAWLIVTDAPTYRVLVRLYEDKQQVRAMVDRWGGWAPIVFHRHSGHASDHRANPRRRHRPARWLRLRPVARVSLLDDRPDDRLARCLLGRPPARSHLRAGNGAAGVGAHELPRRDRGSDSLFYRLLDPRLTEGLRVLSLWRQSDGLLGLRGGVHSRSHAGHLDLVGPGRQGGRGRISRTATSDGDPRGGRVTALLLPAKDRVVVPAARLTHWGR